MGDYINQPTLLVDFIMPKGMKFDVQGGAKSGGSNAFGKSNTIDLSGGGMVTATYSGCFIRDPEQHEYINQLGAMLNGGYRNINVPILTDWNGPFPLVNGIPTPIITGIPHSDDSLFSDGSGYSQKTVTAVSTQPAALNAGIINVQVFGASRRLRWSDWFSIQHPTKGWRLYRYWKVITDDGAENGTYSLAISPPLREAVLSGAVVEFARPMCVMKFPDGFTLPWEIEGFYESGPTIQFVEA